MAKRWGGRQALIMKLIIIHRLPATFVCLISWPTTYTITSRYYCSFEEWVREWCHWWTTSCQKSFFTWNLSKATMAWIRTKTAAENQRHLLSSSYKLSYHLMVKLVINWVVWHEVSLSNIWHQTFMAWPRNSFISRRQYQGIYEERVVQQQEWLGKDSCTGEALVWMISNDASRF
jgi:hypothetical protein